MAQKKKKSLISIVCPVFNEEVAIPLFYNRLNSVLQKIKNQCDFEIIFTNNSSSDRSLEELLKLKQKDSRVKIITYSRNFGYQASILGGLTYASGEAILFIDVDCEDPPELIPEFVNKWQEGFDIVFGIRGNRPEPKIITAMRKLFYRIMKIAADTDIILDMAEFSLITQRVKNEIVKNGNTFPFIRAEIAFSGFRKFGIKYDRQVRIAGDTHYNLYGMTKFALAGILSISTFPLRIGVYLWPPLLLFNILMLVCVKIFESIFAATLLLSVDLLYLISLVTAIGLYVARIYKNGINRPVFIVDWSLSYMDETLEKSE